MKFMVVDDSMVIREQIENILSDSHFDFVGSAKDGLEAVREFKLLRPNVVTMDLTMPKMNGGETIRRMMTYDSSVRILVISALKDKATALRALSSGAYGFLPKPFTSYELKSAIEKLIADMET